MTRFVCELQLTSLPDIIIRFPSRILENESMNGNVVENSYCTASSSGITFMAPWKLSLVVLVAPVPSLDISRINEFRFFIADSASLNVIVSCDDSTKGVEKESTNAMAIKTIMTTIRIPNNGFIEYNYFVNF